MQALALTSLYDRLAHDRLVVRGSDRIEIVAPRNDDARATARRSDAQPTWREILSAYDGERFGRRMAAYASVAKFTVQRFAQEQTAGGAHLEDRRGARLAYARADRLTVPAGATLSITV